MNWLLKLDKIPDYKAASLIALIAMVLSLVIAVNQCQASNRITTKSMSGPRPSANESYEVTIHHTGSGRPSRLSDDRDSRIAETLESITPTVTNTETTEDISERTVVNAESREKATPRNQAHNAKRKSDSKNKGPQNLDESLAPNRLATSSDEAVFWSGIGRAADKRAAVWASERGGATLETTLAIRGIKLPRWNPDDTEVVASWRQASIDFASGAKGHIRVLQGDSLRVDAIFRDEYNSLIKNPNVKSITSINPETGAEVLLWSR